MTSSNADFAFLRVPLQRIAGCSSKMPVSEQATYNNIGNAPALFPVARARPPEPPDSRACLADLLSETALLVIYLLLFAWNILNVRFV